MARECTAIVLTKNEINNIERCLQSLSWCREIIVLDSGSTDQTQFTARALGARVFENIQTGSFQIAEQRNWALRNCGVMSEWVLFLDADETVSPELSAMILDAISNTSSRFDAYELSPRYLFWGRWLKRTQGYPNWHPRLLRLGRVSFSGGVWEHFAAGAIVGRIPIPYDHHANSKGFSDWLERHDRYSSWDAQRIVDYLASGSDRSFATERKLRLRKIAAHLWPLRPIARFFQMYILRLGFTEGMPALVFSLLYAFYESMTVIKIIELRRKRQGLPL